MPLENWIQHSRVDQFLYDWQTVIAGGLALLAALIAVGGSEWRARTAVRAMLASEARLYVEHLIKVREVLKTAEPLFLSGAKRQHDLRGLAVLYPPTVYPAAAAGAMGLLRRPRASAVVDFYGTIERLNFVAKSISNEATAEVSSSNYFFLVDEIEEVCRMSLPLLAKFPFDERDAGFRARIAKWGTRSPARCAMIRLAISAAAFEAIRRHTLARQRRLRERDKHQRRALCRDGGSSIPSVGDGVMLGTAWIDRPVHTRGCTPLPRLFRAAWKCSHARAICDR